MEVKQGQEETSGPLARLHGMAESGLALSHQPEVFALSLISEAAGSQVCSKRGTVTGLTFLWVGPCCPQLSSIY